MLTSKLKRKIVISVNLLLFVISLHSCRSKNTLFEKVPSSKTKISFKNTLEKKPRLSILYYLYYYNGGGVSTGDINNDGLADIYFTANSKGHNKLYLNKGNFEFEDITVKAGVSGLSDWCTGATMADVNGDGYLDIYVSTVSNAYGLKGHNELYINNGNGTFTESAAQYGLNASCFTTQSVFFDYDNDGDLDCYVLNQSHHPHANITDTSKRRTYDPSSGDRLYRNDLNTAARKFTDVSAPAGIYQSNLGYGLGIAVGDLNNDGWNDIYVGNDFHENDYCYINNGDGTFSENGAKYFGHYSRFSMGNDMADYNNDGLLDIVTVDMLPPDEKILKTYGSDENPDIYALKLMRNGYQHQLSRNCLQRNNGAGNGFSDVALIGGIAATDWSWAPLFADFDNDGNKDLFISSGIVKRPVDLDYVRFVSNLKAKGMDKTDKYDDEAIESMPDGSSHPFLFKGDGKYTFTDMSNKWGTGELKGYFNGASYADLDNDGDLDILINCINAPAVVLKNNAPKKNYITLSFKGEGLNKFGIGAKAYLFQKGIMQYQQLMLTRGFQSSCEPRLHFGLDTAATVDSILVVWPDQHSQLIRNVEINSHLVVSRKNANDSFIYTEHFSPPRTRVEEATVQTGIKWKHLENGFLDYNVQYLIPHQLSTRGPKIAVGDVNNDNLDDMYLCGAKGQPGALLLQQPNGKFISSDTALFETYAICEDVDATFFDADGDGDKDLWVVSGGNEMPANEIASADRLFINDGKGHFSAAPGNIPRLFENKSCVTVSDIDKDGDQDVFVGFLADPMRYGIPQNSYLYLNDGHGKFEIAPAKTINLLKIGMVTSASFTDVNNDTWPDLVVAGEWMGVKVFLNNKGTFTVKELPGSTGLWQSLFIADVNGDGRNDILAGNWGHNSKLWSGKNGPLKLYVKDFDRNSSIDQVMCYTVDGKEYPFLAKDELERQLPVLRKAYLSYGEIAGKTVQYMFYDLFKDYIELKAEELGSCYFLNDGNGNFTKKVLPDDLQLAPILSFQKGLTSDHFITGGNFFDVIPYEGRYDAQPMAMFQARNEKLTYLYQPFLAGVKGQVRDLKWIRTAQGGELLAVARNNDSLIFLKPTN